MEEFLKRIFVACDKDKDGYLDRSDLEDVKKEFGLDGDVCHILQQFGSENDAGKISLDEFVKNSRALFRDLSGSDSSPEYNSTDSEPQPNACTLNEHRHPQGEFLHPTQLNAKLSSSKNGAKYFSEDSGNCKTSEGSSMLMGSGKSGKCMASDPDRYQAFLCHMDAFVTGNEHCDADLMEISKQLHVAALTSYKGEIVELKSRLEEMRHERNLLRNEQLMWRVERQKMQREYNQKTQSQTMRITELQSVIAELTRKLNHVNGNSLREEEEEEEEQVEEDPLNDDDGGDDISSSSVSDMEVQGSHAGSKCSCENCDGHQTNFITTTALPNVMGPGNEDVDTLGVGEKGEDCVDGMNEEGGLILGENSPLDDYEEDRKEEKHLQEQLSKVLGALESRLEDRSKYVSTPGDHNKDDAESGLVLDSNDVSPKWTDVGCADEMSALFQQVDMLKRDKRSLEKQLHDVNVQGYVYQKGNTTLGQEELRKVREENTYLRSKLRKAEEEAADEKATHNSIKADNERLLKQNRALLGNIDLRSSDSCTLKSSHRSHSPSRRHRTLPRSNSLPQPPQQQPQHTTTTEIRNPLRPTLVESSDLGSSISDESQRTELSRTLLRHLHKRVPDTLLQTLVTYRTLEQVFATLVEHFVTELEEKGREGEINVQRVETKLAHVQSQNDLLQLSLDESRQNADRLSLLCGKYESNNCAWSLAVENTEQLIQTYEVMLQLQESEADIYAANCHVAGINNFDTIKSITSTKSSHSEISLASEDSQVVIGEEGEIRRSYNKRKDAESQARELLLQLDKKYENVDGDEPKLDEASYKSRTSTGSSLTSNCTDELSKDEEHRLRDYIKKLKTERGVYKGTVVELESVHEYCDKVYSEENANIDHVVDRTHDLNIDIEAAVTLQEVQALKEERAELQHRIYLLEKEKRAAELKMTSRDAQEQAYIVTIEHLKSEVKEHIRSRKQLLKEGTRGTRPNADRNQDDETLSTSSSTHSGPISNPITVPSNADDLPRDLAEAQRRETKLKTRIHELVETLEKLSKNSEVRHKQTAEYISDLKKANGALVTAYEKAKKRHASRLKKFEQQLVQMAEKYQTQIRVLKDQIAELKVVTSPAPQVTRTETSL